MDYFGRLITLLFLTITSVLVNHASGQPGTSIPPTVGGYADHDPINDAEKMMVGLKREIQAFVKAFSDQFQECRLKQHPHAAIPLESEKTQNMTLQDLYLKIIVEDIFVNGNQRCELLAETAAPKTNTILQCVFADYRVNQSAKQMIQNPFFESHLKIFYPVFSNPAEVKARLKKLIIEGQLHGSKK